MGLIYNSITAKEAKEKSLEKVDEKKIIKIFEYIRNASEKGKLSIVVTTSDMDDLCKGVLERKGFLVSYHIGDKYKIRWDEA